MLILSSIFFMGIYFIPEGFTLGTFIFGIIVCIIGLFFVKDDDTDGNDDSDDSYDE